MKGNYLIIGASGGIGVQLSEDLNEASCQLLLGIHNKQMPTHILSEVYKVDATNFKSIHNFIEKGLKKFGSIDGIVNLAGNLILKPAHRASEEEFDDTININLKSSFGVIRSAGQLLEDCSVVLLSTAAASIGLSNHELICSAKAGIEGLSRSAAKTYSRKNIRVNTVSPGLTRTPLAENITQNPIALKASEKMHALGRIGEPRDISSMIMYLLNKNNNWITGQNFIVDGGLSSTK
tara:strand:+ start:865 stop:1572 length:708 start_codon:yes stop_codon:yes gene_type:complete